jgi:hypothetical protein
MDARSGELHVCCFVCALTASHVTSSDLVQCNITSTHFTVPAWNQAVLPVCPDCFTKYLHKMASLYL